MTKGVSMKTKLITLQKKISKGGICPNMHQISLGQDRSKILGDKNLERIL